MYENFGKTIVFFCEENLHSYIVQPANVWSSLIVSLIGIYIIYLGKKHKSSSSKFLGVVAILLGFFSALYHASSIFLTQFFDNSSSFLLTAFMLASVFSRLKPRFFTYRKKVLLFYLILFVDMAILYFIRAVHGVGVVVPILAIEIFTTALLEFYLYKNKTSDYKIRNLIFSALLLLTAFTMWIIDFARLWCDPYTFHFINGHAVWHIISGFAFIFLYHYYRQFDKKLV